VAWSGIWTAALFAVALVVGIGCSNEQPPAPAPSATPARVAPVTVTRLPDGQSDVASQVRDWVRSEAAAATARGGKPLIYVGAEWCEPCKRFKAAAARGELDGDLPGLTLLELDADRDEAALVEMGCKTRMIPLLAVPDGEGRCTSRRMEGAIKGEGAVAFMTPKVKALLQ
jgi:thiol-disulfide isomerase/thioredoxin